MKGRCAKFAYDPAVVVGFLDAHSTRKVGGQPPRKRRYINGVEVNRDVEARVIRRWRHNAEGVTLQGLARLLTKFNFTINALHEWASVQGVQPILRGKLPGVK